MDMLLLRSIDEPGYTRCPRRGCSHASRATRGLRPLLAGLAGSRPLGGYSHALRATRASRCGICYAIGLPRTQKLHTFNGTAWISSGKPGTRRALRDDVAKSHKELRAWKLADVVRRHIVALCARPVVRRDFKFCDQADRAAASACRNLAEGFARYGHAEFARFVSIARGSLGELRDSIDEARLKGYLGDKERDELERRIRGAMSSAGALRVYLLRTPTPESRKQRAQPGRSPSSGQ